VERRIRQGRAGVRPGEEQDPLVAQDRVGDAERRARAARAHHGDDRRVGGECLAGRRSAFGRAELVLRRELDRVVQQRAGCLIELAVQVVDRELERVHLVLTEYGVRAADHLRSPEIDRLVRPHLDASELDGRAVDLAGPRVTVVVVAGTRRRDDREHCPQGECLEPYAVLHEAPLLPGPPR
jgi:hypothetical protein